MLQERWVRLPPSQPSGGTCADTPLVAPFTNAVDGLWDFRLPRVHSISTSGHKFGLVYPGLGWAVWRSDKWLPKELIFELHYLGGTEQTFTLNFSRPSAQVIAQYFNFLALGREGYRNIMHNALCNARLLSKALEASGWYTCVSDIHRKYDNWGGEAQSKLGVISHDDARLYNPGLPVVAFHLSDEFRKEYPHVKQQAVSTLLRVKGYIIPSRFSPLTHPDPIPPTDHSKTTTSLPPLKASKSFESSSARA